MVGQLWERLMLRELRLELLHRLLVVALDTELFQLGKYGWHHFDETVHRNGIELELQRTHRLELRKYFTIEISETDDKTQTGELRKQSASFE